MAKLIKYNLATTVNAGTEDETVVLYSVELPYTEANEAIAKAEAYNGEYTIEEDDSWPESESASEISVYDELAAAYSEGVQSA